MMATGGRGHSKPRTSASESHQRSSWQRSTSASDKEDNISIHSIPNDLRPNNWDFSDWRPSAHFDQTKRRKKGNPEWEREQSLSQDSPPSSERQHGTPRTYPRTKITPNTPTSQRVALENLKQHMTFSDLEDQLSTDGEKNNERNVVIKRENPPNYTRQDTSCPGDPQPQIMANGQPDSNQIVARLMQVRDYIKQATSLMDSLQKSGDRPGPRDEVERLQSLIEHLKEQEKGYTTLLQRVLERSPRISPRPRIEDKLGLDSGDDNEEEENKAESESSEDSETMDDTVVSGRRQPEWDFELSESEMDTAGGMQRAEALDHLVALRQQQELLKKLIEQQEQMRALKGRQAALLALQQDAEKKLAEARGRANQAHSEVLACEEGSQSLVMSRGSGRSERENNAPGLIEGATGELSALRQRLLTLRNELKQTSNEDAQDERPTNNQQGFQLPLSALQMSREQLKNKLQELQEKKQHMDEMLEELQVMRLVRVEDFLSATRDASTTSGPSTSAPNSAAAAAAGLNRHDLYDGEAAIARAEETESMAKETLELLGAREKISKLNEVRQRLNQLKSLMSYYQSADSGTTGPQEEEEQSSLPGYSDFGEGEAGQRDRGSLIMPAERDIPAVQGSGGGAKMDNQSRFSRQPQQDDNSSQSSSDTESQLSSLGPWGDDPEIQEKVRKLKAAKEKLKRLQSLVAMVQQTPEVIGDLPDNIAEIAASLEEVESQLTQADDRNNASVSEGEVQLNTQQPLNLQATERNKFYENKMREQLQELQQLKEEKERLLSIQQQLQKLHGRFQTVNQTEDETDAAAPKPSSTSQKPSSEPQVPQTQQQSGPSVKFSSNEEVYDKMRKQRMLREELRDKKKQLESIMKKDRNKRSYYKNQDNQSDSVSYSTDAYGASASIDATMATWGGSTVDALESITEDGAVDHQDNEGDEGVDDAYPSDGIVQVEEEEEENDSDNETYTIEEDVRQRRRARASQQQASKQNKNRNKRSFPRASDQNQGGARPKERNTWNPKQQPSFSKWSRSNKNKGHSKQENYRSAEEIVEEDEQNGGPIAPNSMEALQQQLEQTARMCQTILGNSPSTTGIYNQPRGPSGVTQDFQQIMQQQQMIITMNQCYQQMALQQMEMQNLQRQFQGLLSQMPDMGDIENQNESCLSRESRLRSLTSLQSPGMNRFSPLLLQPNSNFQRQLSEGLHSNGYRRSTDNLYPGSNAEVNMFGTDRSRNQRQIPVRSEQNDQNAELSFQKSKRKSSKSQKESPSQQGISSLPTRYTTVGSQTIVPIETQSREHEETEVPRLNIEQIEKRRRELLQSAGLRSLFVSEPGNRGQERSNKTKSAPLRPGLSGGISGAGYMESMSVTSSILSSQMAGAQGTQGDQEQQGYEEARESDDPNELSLFEALRETIYSEVATLISQNENRPHYLIELFRELQRLSTDYLRQRALYDIKDLVSKYLVDEGTDSVTAPPPPWLNPNCNNFTVSELTPSESIVTSDEEEVRAKLREKVSAVEKRKLSKLPRSNSMKSDQYDYQEEAEITSSISTPSTAYWESPFAHESLGETVINLDKTLKKMREYEKRMAEQESEAKAERNMAGGSNNGRVERSNEACSSSAMDQGSESSANSDYPRINTQLLDRHIKTIMKEVMPVIKEHMDNTCSPQLLAYIKNLALSLTRQYDSGQEFSKFFHRQLGTVLQDSLAKFEGKKMRECGEDLVVDISEVLFNELAFFRLMQDLDDPMVVDKIKAGSWPEFSDRKRTDDQSEESDTTESSTTQASDNEQEEASLKASPREMEDLGKARDDEMASQVQIQEMEDKDEELDLKYDAVQIELSISETKPFTRIGSDEDDEDEDADESQSNEDPSETAVSRDYRLEDASWEEDGEEIINVDDNSAFISPSHPTGVVSAEGDQNDADQGAENSEADPSMANGASHFNGDLLNGDIEFITMDDLPPSLQVISKEDLQARMMEEQESTSGTAGVLASMEGETELAGDGEFLKEPDGASG
ncbi:hypothetical protein CHS0354_041982 [Potamilus streckersoni]|uniref:Pericentriolar material 1 protein C-terminal domain-containing protein n=1 Tax=Potamilus streckersoni TaxID=2493646 RepID=A0AAE0W9G5_9BIVA|nr:hypothetical protein CHS0354_041982 [Potamilus streckersoni]